MMEVNPQDLVTCPKPHGDVAEIDYSLPGSVCFSLYHTASSNKRK